MRGRGAFTVGPMLSPMSNVTAAQRPITDHSGGDRGNGA